MAHALADFIVNILGSIPDTFKVVVLAMMPITEYQLAIPLAIERFHFSPLAAYLLALFGSLLLFFPLFFGLKALRDFFATHIPALARPIDAFLERGERKLKDNYRRFGGLALFLFLVIPFPFTGIWTATAAAVALKIPLKEAGLGILFGVLGGQAVVVFVTLATSAAL
jgi:uncharacterized membrane protein